MQSILNPYVRDRAGSWVIAAVAVIAVAVTGTVVFVVVDPDGAKGLLMIGLLLLALLAGGLFALGLYFLPTILAVMCQHRNAAAIAVTNLLFGWTFIGWAVALIWSITESRS